MYARTVAVRCGESVNASMRSVRRTSRTLNIHKNRGRIKNCLHVSAFCRRRSPLKFSPDQSRRVNLERDIMAASDVGVVACRFEIDETEKRRELRACR